MAKQTLTVKVHIDGVRQTLAAFKQLPKDASNELRDASGKIARILVDAAKRGASIDPQATAVATTVKVARDRVPVVVAGGSKRVTKNRAPAWALLFASEFGMTRRSGWYGNPRYGNSGGRQYSPHQGQRGRWFFPSVESEQERIAMHWNRAVDAVVRRFGEGG